jgi:tetratricopeptide (TPR) repeat protein
MAPEARFMVGARSRLGIRGEVAYELAPLPEVDRANARNADLVRLFNLRARRANSRFQADDPALIADLVGGLDGNPLAIEIAAGLMHAWSPSDLLFTLRGKTGLAVHRVLEAAWEQLDEDECTVLSHCSVYPGGFDSFGADAVVGDEQNIDSAMVLKNLRRRGLIASGADADAPEVLRYVLGPWIRRFALAQLSPEEREPLYQRLADRILAICESWPDRAWERDGPEVVARINIEWFNLIGIIEWGIADQSASADALDRAMRALLVLAPVFRTRGPAEIHLQLLDGVLQRCDSVLGADPLLQVQLLAARANTWRMAARFPAARADLERGLKIAERWADVYGRALCANTSGLLHWDMGAPDEAIVELRLASDLFREVGNELRQGMATGTLGVMRMEIGEHDLAERDIDAAIAIFRSIGARHFEGMYLGNLGLLYRRIDREFEALELYSVARRIHRDTGDVRLQGIMAMNLGALEFRLGVIEQASKLYAQGMSLAREVGDRSTEAGCIASLGIMALDRSDYQASRRLLLQAMAVNRDLGNRRGEASDTGYLGMLHHLKGERDKAADYYRRAVRMTVECGSRRQELIFLAFLGALEAEMRNIEDARAVFEAATPKADRTGEVGLIAMVKILALDLRLLEGVITADKAVYLVEKAAVTAHVEQAEAVLGGRRGLQRFATRVVRNALDTLLL